MSQLVSPIRLTSGELLIDKYLTISGPGVSELEISRDFNAADFRIFTVTSGTVNISGFTIYRGFTSAGGGGILNNGTLSVSYCRIGGNNGWRRGGGGGNGGGILNQGTLTISNSTINSNGDGGATGGGIFNNGSVIISNSTIEGNSVNTEDGGGIFNNGPMIISNSTISYNHANNGGGIFNKAVMTISNSTVSGNGVSYGGLGGGILNQGTLTIGNSTISNNIAAAGGGGIFNNIGTVTLNSSIVAGNNNGEFCECGQTANIGGTVAPASSFNLIGIGDAGGLTNGFNHNQVGVADPGLGPLADHGGPTLTHALLESSPALDAGSNAFITNPPFSGPPFTDQRGTGFDRIVDGPDADTSATVDVGAFELQKGVIEDITDKTMDEDTTLQFTFFVGPPDSIDSVTATSSNIALVPNSYYDNLMVNGSGPSCTLTIRPVSNRFGASTITVTVKGKDVQSRADTFVLTVNPVAHTPSVTNATTTGNTQTTAGLVISRNPVDGAEVTHFKITSIQNGTLFKTDSTTQINKNDFITLAEGQAGLKFTPANNVFSPQTSFGFYVQASTSNSNVGLGPGKAWAGITVRCGETRVVTNSNDLGPGSLAQTIWDACIGSTITFDMSQVVSPIMLRRELRIDRDLTISGPGADVLTIQRSNLVETNERFRIFNITSGTVNISGLTIAGGRSEVGFHQDNPPRSNIGLDGGGILNNGTLTIINCTVRDNQTGHGGDGYLWWDDSCCRRHPGSGAPCCPRTWYYDPPGRGGNGGGIASGGPLTIINSLISGNETGPGGAGYGGEGYSGGGGPGGAGGAIFSSGPLTIINSTISGNRTGPGGDGTFRGPGGWGGGITGSAITLKNTIIAGNAVASGGQGADVSGTVDPESSFNLIDIGGSGGLIDGVNHNQVGVVNPGLGPLAINGGPTQTYALLPGSPAIDAGSNAFITHPPFIGPPFTDERGTGFDRIVNTTVDIGAFESRGFTIAATSGSSQSTPILSAFGSPLVATVLTTFGEPVAGVVVSFTAPASGASGTFSGNVMTTTATTNSIGVVTSPTFTANGTPGGPYEVVASIGTGLPTATFSLTNLKVNQTITFGALTEKTLGDPDFTVSASSDSGLAVSFAASGNCTVSNAVVHITGAGSCTITASQIGDATFSAAAEVPRSFDIAKASTATGVTSSGNQSGPNQAVTFTATVTSGAGTPTGTVQFKDNGTNLGAPVTLNGSGVAAFTTSSLAAGIHTITADYSGDANFLASTGALAEEQQVGSIIRFNSAAYDTTESSLVMTITVERVGNTTEAVTVDYATPDDSAATPTILPCSTPGFVSARCDFTTAMGTLKFAAGETSKTFTVLISQDNYVEGAESLTLTLSNLSGNAFLGLPATATLTIADDLSEPAEDPMDDSQNFVRQHYHDFLNREPVPNDLAGLNFWTSEMGDYWADPGYHELKCQNVSGAFFLSIEFQESGYYVYRMYQAGFGDIDPATVPVPVRYLNFMRDTQELQTGVIVGQENWQARLERHKQAYALEFVQRPEFLLRYPLLAAPAAVVHLLNANAGEVLTSSERETLIRQLSVSPADPALRAEVVRNVAENAALKRQEFNRAFVLMQYFGYLRRDPDAAPEPGLNFEGYNFWLHKLNSFNGNFVKAEMVKAFINSNEYRQRFGTP